MPIPAEQSATGTIILCPVVTENRGGVALCARVLWIVSLCKTIINLEGGKDEESFLYIQ